MIKDIEVKGHNPLKFKNLTKDCVYIMEDEDTNVLYIGRSSKLKINGRMRAHEKSSKFFPEVYKIFVIPFESYIDMCLYEILYINHLKPKYNKDCYQGVTKFNVELVHERLHYYTKGIVCREYKERKEDFERKTPIDRLEERKTKFEGVSTVAGSIVEVFKDKVYMCNFNCNSCGGKGTSSLKNLINEYTKSCGCLSNIENTSPYYKEYKVLGEYYNMDLYTLKDWRKRYNNLCRKFRSINRKELPLSFKKYVECINSLGLDFENVGNYKGKYYFCLEDMVYKKS